jgi:UDP-N-acetylglucosamine--N-acetylmuramyl-(pentapeptide) pyrophosphoryl-undecaprenol N-acetylglucosamine transferase
MNKVVALTGGGTAGHIWPAIEVGKTLKKEKSDLEIIYLGMNNSREEVLANEAGFKFFPIKAGKWRRYFSLANILTPFYIWRGFRQAKKILQEKDVKVLFAKGGYVSFPVVLAAHRLQIPVIGHESDSIVGKANLTLIKRMWALAVAFPRSLYPKKLKEKLVYTGIPLRDDFFKETKDWPKDLKLKDDLPVLVITGGSTGAEYLNQFIFKNLKNLLTICQIIHLTGEQGIREAKKIKAELHLRNYYPIDFSHQIPAILNRADLVLSRAGAGTLFELACLSKGTILIPYPYAAQNHQEKNAYFAKRLGGAMVFRQKGLDEGKLLVTINHLLKNPQLAEDMGRKLHGLYVPDASQRIAEMILENLE